MRPKTRRVDDPAAVMRRLLGASYGSRGIDGGMIPEQERALFTGKVKNEEVFEVLRTGSAICVPK